jgi:formate-dependent nitrite reductase membrane component NrfD
VSNEDPHPLGLPSESSAPDRDEEPPTSSRGREDEWVARDGATRDTTPALGTRGEPASWRRASEDKHVALARPSWGDAGWSFLYGHDTHYAADAPEEDEVAATNRRMRSGAMPGDLHGPFIKPPVWTWEVPVYFWVGGVASGSAFVALAADLAGDEWSGAIARKVALFAVLPAPALLIGDLGRPARFLNMLRIFKPRSPMNLGAWCLVAFTGVAAGAVGADLIARPRTARRLGALNALLGGYLGSYTGVLLATTAVPVWARSRLFLGPIFVSTATATGAAATRLTLAVAGQPEDDPTQNALGRLEAAAILTELTLSMINERRLGALGEAFSQGTSQPAYRAAKLLIGAGLALNVLGRRRFKTPVEHVASVLYLAGGLAFRFAWIEAGKASARDDEAVALMARASATADERLRRGTERRVVSDDRPPRAGGAVVAALRAWSRTVGRMSLVVERRLRAAYAARSAPQ